MAGIAFTKTDSRATTSVGVTGETRKTLAVGVVGVGNANGIRGAAINARVVAGMRCRAGPIRWTVLVGDAVDASAAYRLVVGVTHVETDQRTATLGHSVLHQAEGVLAAVKTGTAVDAASDA